MTLTLLRPGYFGVLREQGRGGYLRSCRNGMGKGKEKRKIEKEGAGPLLVTNYDN